MQYYNFQKMSIEKEGSLENHTGTKKSMKLQYRAFQTIQMNWMGNLNILFIHHIYNVHWKLMVALFDSFSSIRMENPLNNSREKLPRIFLIFDSEELN